MTTSLHSAPRAKWLPLRWEPVAGTGERIGVGAVHELMGEIDATRFVPSDVLARMYGEAGIGAAALIDGALRVFRAAAQASGLAAVEGLSCMGVHAGELREAAVNDLPELLAVAALLTSSLARVDEVRRRHVTSEQPSNAA